MKPFLIFSILITLLISSLHHSAQASECAHPFNGDVNSVAQIENDLIAIGSYNCLYFIKAKPNHAPKIIKSYQLPKEVDDIKWHPQQKRLFYFLPPFELRSLNIKTMQSKSELNLAPLKKCDDPFLINIPDICSIGGYYDIHLNGDQIYFKQVANRRHRLLVASLKTHKAKTIFEESADWDEKLIFDMESKLLLRLFSKDNGTAFLQFRLDSHNNIHQLIAAPQINARGLRNIFLLNRDFFLTSNGILYRTSDHSEAYSFDEQIEEVYRLNDRFLILVVIEKNEKPSLIDDYNFFKAKILDKNLNEISFEYLSKRPLAAFNTNLKNTILLINKRGDLNEIFTFITLRNMP